MNMRPSPGQAGENGGRSVNGFFAKHRHSRARKARGLLKHMAAMVQ